jgi:aminoglycoside 3-N-acetyltransferase
MIIKTVIRKVIKEFWGIDGISFFVKKQKKVVMRGIYKKKYIVDDLVTEMCDLGMKSGSIVFIHSAMTEFYNYKGTGVELIEQIINVIGADGTLLMPAYPPKKHDLIRSASQTDEIVFDVNSTPSGAGYLSEVFRTYSGVERSINLQHSVCAYGSLARYFVEEHHLSEVACDLYSPYYKLAQTDGLIFSLGLEPYLRNVTMVHCTESILRNKYSYFASFFNKSIRYSYLDKSGNIGFHDMIIPVTGGVRSKKVIKQFFDKTKFKRSKISNLLIEMVESNYMYKRCIDLADEGISIYLHPSSAEYIKNGRFIKINEKENN